MESDILIIGAGPAGLSSGVYSARSGYSTLIIDPMGPGGELLFIDEIENYPGSGKVSGYVLSEMMEKQAEEFGAKIQYMRALSIKKENNRFYTLTDEGEIVSKAVIIATGSEHRKLGVKGEEEYRGKGVSYCATCDGPFFKKKKVVVVGGGDTALSDALYLSQLAEEVVIVHRRDSLRAVKILQDRVKKKDNISLILSASVTEIEGDSKEVKSVILSNGERVECDGVFVFVGLAPASSFISPLLETENGFIKTDSHQRTSVPGVFAAGDVTTTSFRQVVTASSDGAKASHSADEYIQSLGEEA